MSVQTEATSAAPAVRRELLRVDDLSGGFRSDEGGFTEILKSVSFSIEAGTITAVVGETGSGKSMTALAVMGLLPRGFRRTAGAVHFEGRDLLALAPAQLRAIRGVRIGMVFQDARAALNPVFTIGQQLVDVWRAHHRSSKREAWRVATEALDRVKIPEPGRRVKQYPHEFSGGMAQRAMLAMAMISDPSLLILDEPTTGLDVTIQADVMELIVELARSSALTTCLITHDLGVVAQTCDNVVVMQDGGVRETGTCEQIFTAAADPYTRRLITASRMGEGRA